MWECFFRGRIWVAIYSHKICTLTYAGLYEAFCNRTHQLSWAKTTTSNARKKTSRSIGEKFAFSFLREKKNIMFCLTLDFAVEQSLLRNFWTAACSLENRFSLRIVIQHWTLFIVDHLVKPKGHLKPNYQTLFSDFCCYALSLCILIDKIMQVL